MPLPSSIRHGYGVAAFSLALGNTAILFFLLKFLIDEAGLSPGQAGTVLLVGKAWDAVSDPVVGRLSDRTRTAMGARRPWVLGASIPFALLFGALWWGLPWQGVRAAVAYAGLLVLYNTAYTSVVVPYGAMTPILAEDYDERTALNGARMGWSMMGGIVAGILMPVLIERTGSYRIPGLVLAVLILPGLWWMVAATAGRDQGGTAGSDGRGMWTVLYDRSFRRVAGLFLAAWTSIAVLAALIPFYAEHHLGRPDLLDALFAAIQVAALAFVPVVVWGSNRVQKHVAYGIGMISWGGVLCLLAAVPAGQIGPVLALAAIAGAGVAAAHVLPWAMLPDVVESDAVATGVPRAGAFYGVMTFLEKLATAVSLWGIGLVLEGAGYVEGAEIQPASAILAIRVLIGPVPAVVLLVAGVAAFVWPPLTRKTHHDLRRRLAADEGARG